MDLNSGSGRWPVAVSCEHSNEPRIDREFLDELEILY